MFARFVNGHDLHDLQPLFGDWRPPQRTVPGTVLYMYVSQVSGYNVDIYSYLPYSCIMY